jgi:hypothetical protein
MFRRTFIATFLLALIGRLSLAQQSTKGSPTILDVFDFEGLLRHALRVATKIDGNAEQMLREIIATAAKRLEVPPSSLEGLPSGRVLGLMGFLHGVPTLLFQVLEEGKTPEGIVVTQASVEKALKSVCPIYPFC